MADVKYVIVVDDSGATKRVQTFDAAITDLGKSSGTTSKFGGLMGDTFRNLVPAFTVATLAADGILKMFGFVKDSIIDSVGAAIEAEKVDRALESTLEIVGQSAGGTADKIQRYASALQRQTLYDDEAIKSAQALIITMRGTASQIDVATKGAIGLATVFQMDLQSAARAVAQGMEGNYIQLSRLIPTIREAKTEGEKHSALMDFMAGAYRRAEADTKTFGGRLIDIKDTYNELQESIGTFITKNEGVIATLAGAKEIIDWLIRNTPKAGKNLEGAVAALPSPLLNFLRIANLAKKANEEYAASWEGFTASLLDFRKTALEPLPVKILDPEIAMRKFIATTKLLLIEGKKLETIPFKLFGDHPPEEQIYQLTKLPPAIRMVELVMKILGTQSTLAGYKMAKTWGDSLRAILDNTRDAFAQIGQFSMALDGIFAQSQRNKEIALDNEYQKRSDYINANIKDEEARAAAFDRLNAEFDKKRREIQRSAAKQQKAIALMNAFVNVHEAVTKALAQGGFFGGPVFAAIIAAMGAVQIAMIAAQPLPLAKGAYFKKPTVLPAASGSFAVAEAGSPEIVSPEPVMRRIVREEGRGGVHIEFGSGAIVIQAQTLDDRTIAQAGNRIFKEIEAQARIHGRRMAWQT